jgi:FlaA1/EpsC-like NDP-sugar epimerase
VRRIIAVAVQLALVVVSNRLAFALRFDGDIAPWALASFWQMLPWLVAIRGATFLALGLHQRLSRETNIYDLRNIAIGVAVSTGAFALVALSPLGVEVYPRSVYVIDALLCSFLLAALRVARRSLSLPASADRRVLVYGAGDAGEQIVRDMLHNPSHGYLPVGFVDDDHAKVGKRICGVRVLGTREDLATIVKEKNPTEVLIAIPHAEPVVVRGIVRALEPFKISIQTLPSLREMVDGRVEVGRIRKLSTEDLLARAPVGLDREPVKALVEGRRVLVTGAGGSIGSELCRQIAALEPASLVLFERYENSLHDVANELRDAGFGRGTVPVIGDITDGARLDAVMSEHQPDIVFHAAAHKHVPLMEYNPCEAVKNNVRGTRLLIEAAERHGVDRFIFISTDKAVNPTSVMGATKRIAELLVEAQSRGSGTTFLTVRFGNVLGSNGSVVPRFLDQIKRGGPVTVTHPEMRRFFMLVPEAVQLVLHAAARGTNGCTYVLEMGDQVKIVDMARTLIRLAGLVPDKEIPIVFVGLRPGEKLYEELVADHETREPSGVDSVFRVRPKQRCDITRLCIDAAELEEAAAAGDAARTLADMVRIVPEFGPRVPEPVREPVSAVAAQESEDAVLFMQGVGKCPSCRSLSLQRSHARSVTERIRRSLTNERLHRCVECGWRGWLRPLDYATFPEAAPTHEPDFSALDAAIGNATARGRAFSPRNLQ